MQRRKTKKRTRTAAFDIHLVRANIAWTLGASMQHLYPHNVSSEQQHAFLTRFLLKPGGYKEMSSIFADQWRLRITSSNAGGGGGGGVSANEYSCAQTVTWSPYKFWSSPSQLMIKTLTNQPQPSHAAQLPAFFS